MTNNTNTITWGNIDKVIAATGQRGLTSCRWDKEAGTYTVQAIIPTPGASIRPKVVRVIKDLLDEALDAVAEHVSVKTIAKMTYDYVVDDDRGLMVFVATAPDEVRKVEHEVRFSGGEKDMLPVCTIIQDHAEEAVKQAGKLMGKDAFLAKADQA
jgi:hypothetical protein